MASIMIIEDETLLLEAIEKKLKLAGMETIGCTTGKQAWDYLNTLDKMPDIIWLDYYLPDMNGEEFMQLLLQNDKLKNIPVAVVSNSASDAKVKEMNKLGAKLYLLKSDYKLEEIITYIEDLIKNK